MPSKKKKGKPLYDVDEIVRQYEQVRPSYLGFTEKLHNLLQDILETAHIKYHVIERRTKEVSSFRDKITRSSKQYSDPLQQITDLVGLRIIVYYLEDVSLVSKLIEQEFRFDPSASGDKADLLHPNEFGYRSVHYIVSLSSNRGALLEWHSFRDIKSEIQVRTVLQHAWAAISHTLQYKKEEDVPSIYRRRLSRLAGLLELSDEEFSGLRKEQQLLSENVSAKISEGSIDVELNAVTAKEYLNISKYIQSITNMAREIGFDFDSSETELSVSISDLISVGGHVGISTIAELDESLRQTKRWAKGYLQSLLNSDKKRGSKGWTVDEAFLATLLLISVFSDKFDKTFLVDHGWGENIAIDVIKAAKERNLNGAE